MKIRLIIDGRTADLNEDNLVVMTYQATDAEKPAAVKNSYSQNVTLPATPTNDAIFSHILRADWAAGTGFNPLARTPFEIRNEAQDILVSGYLKLNSGEYGKGYDVTLFGGLGGLFFSLMYRANGEKRTLADIEWPNGDQYVSPSAMRIGVAALDFVGRYNDGLDESLPYAFAPFNEGIPKDDFDAKKAYYSGSAYTQFSEITLSRTQDGVTYRPKNGIGKGVIIDLENEHDAWAMQDFRNTQQRPLWSIKAFLDAICQSGNNGGYTVTIDGGFLDSEFVQKGWVTLGLDWGKSISSGKVTFAALLADTASPAEYLLSIAKICGLMFVYDEARKAVRILTRNTYYRELSSSRLSLHGILAEDRGKTITPLLMSDKWQIFSADTVGAKAEDFAERKGRQYGSLWIDTAYEFGGKENEVLKDSIFKGAADTLASSIDYRRVNKFAGVWLKFAATDSVKYTLYSPADAQGNQSEQSFSPDYGVSEFSTSDTTPYNPTYPLSLFCELPEFKDADGKGVDGADVILFYGGEQALINGFYASETTAEMLELNGDKPCWNLDGREARIVEQFPHFQRQIGGDNAWSALFGKPGEFFTPNASYINAVPADGYVGQRAWSRWIAERCDVDGRRMKCWVNLRTRLTPKVDANLLRRFWYYEGAWWVLDKINAHSLTTDDLTECEFIKVLDIRNYTAGQDFGFGYLLTSEGYKVLTADGEYVRVML